MTIKIADRLPPGQVQEFIEVETTGCSLGPNRFEVEALAKGKRIVIFGLPGAFTPTCSAQHLPGYLRHYADFKAKGIDEIWCFSVNDAFVMGAWGRDQKVNDRVRMIADGSGDYTAKLGLELDLRAHGLGTRCQRFSMLVEDGVVSKLNIEAAGKFDVSSAETMLRQLG
jgi:glutaredoxin/glutathione-dependent peroxiredoxin